MQTEKLTLDEVFVDKTLNTLEAQFPTSKDVLVTIANRPVTNPELLTDEEVDERFAEAVKTIEEDTTPEERETFRELRMNKVSAEIQKWVFKDSWE
jgi:hypothetical protein